MNTQQLKAKLLDLLIKGELTSKWRENHKDIESAEVLLERIRAEKEKKLNDELKAKGKKPNAKVEIKEVSDNDKPFEIPASWKWCRLGDIAEYRKGPFGSSLTKSMFVPKDDSSIKVYEQKNAIKKDYTLGSYFITKEKFETMKSFIVEPNDIIISCAGTIGEVYQLPENAPIGIINQALMRVKLHYNIFVRFWILYFDFVLKKEASREAFGKAIKNIPPFDILKSYPFPLPPLEEQKELARIAQTLLTMVDDIDSSYTDLGDLSKKAKAKVLDLLIKGELTSKWRENHKDIESAEVLLERIRAEKEKKLNDELKAKGKKPNAKVEIKEVSDNDKPFEIPASWKWCRLGDISNINMGQSPDGNSISEDSNYTEFHQGKTLFGKDCLKKSNQFTNQPTKTANKDSILLCVRAPVGKVNLLDREICIGRGLCAVNVIKEYIDKVFVYVLLQTLEKDFIRKGTGTTFVAISKDTIFDEIIPLPPLEEQKELARIAEKFLNMIDSLTDDIDSTQNGEEENE